MYESQFVETLYTSYFVNFFCFLLYCYVIEKTIYIDSNGKNMQMLNLTTEEMQLIVGGTDCQCISSEGKLIKTHSTGSPKSPLDKVAIVSNREFCRWFCCNHGEEKAQTFEVDEREYICSCCFCTIL